MPLHWIDFKIGAYWKSYYLYNEKIVNMNFLGKKLNELFALYVYFGELLHAPCYIDCNSKMGACSANSSKLGSKKNAPILSSLAWAQQEAEPSRKQSCL